MKYQSLAFRLLAYSLLALSLFIISLYIISFFLGPPPLTMNNYTTFYSDDGNEIGEELSLNSRHYVPLSDISPYAIQSTIIIEDKRFYEHNGFDIKRILAAALEDIKSLSLKEGASTLSQQYARNLYLTHEKTWKRKLKEAFYTIRLEMNYSKDEILEGYLNTIYFGHGAYGIEAASNYFFNKSAKDLSLAEAAMLAGIPKGPTYYSPLNDKDKANARQQKILNLLYENKLISEVQYNEALGEKLVYSKQNARKSQSSSPYFIDAAIAEAAQLLQQDKEIIQSGGYKIYTTLNVALQNELELAIENTMNDNHDIEVGSIAIDPKTGRIVALIGGRSYEKSPFNRAISAKRMAGSTFKPFLYYKALENNYTASTKLMSKPTSFVLDDGKVYKPRNFNGYYANDSITLAQAIALSDNIYAVKTNLFIGPEKLVQSARTFGIKGDLPNVPSLALGTASVSVKEMVTAYAMLANGEKKLQGHTVEKIVDRHGKTVYQRKDQREKTVLDRTNAFILTHLLTGMFDETLNGYMSVTGATIKNKLTRPYAGKSGTTDYDSWMIGYSPVLVAGIWTGYDDNRPLEKASDLRYAKEIWATFMENAHKELPKHKFIAPLNVIGIAIDPVTGKRATPYCPTSRVMYFKKGTEPNSYCMHHFPNEHKKEKIDEHKEEKGILKRLFDFFS